MGQYMELTALQKGIIKVMQDKDNFDENGKPKNRIGMQQCDFLHLLKDRDKELPSLVEALVGLRAMGFVTIGAINPKGGKHKITDVGHIQLTQAGRRF